MAGGSNTKTQAATNTASQEMSNSSNSGTLNINDEKSFGDLLAQLLRTLPEEGSSRFLVALSGLNAAESYELCEYVSKLRDEKQFRVIKAMAESTFEGKKKFLSNLRKKFEKQKEQERELKIKEEKDIEVVVKRKQALNAAARVKMLGGGANKYHSFNAALGSENAIKENVADTVNIMKIIENNNNIPPVSVVRALSSSSVVTKEDIKNVEIMLSNAQIGQSEMDLRELEINKKMFAQEKSNAASNDKSNDVKSFINKRDRTESDRDLMKQEQKPSQNSRGKEESCIESSIFSAASSISSSNDNCDKDEIADGEDPDAPTTKRWTKNQDAALRESVRIHGEKNWKAIAELVPGRNHAQCLQRWRKVLKPGLVKGHWSFEEDQVLEFLVTQGCHNWGQIAERIPGRTPKQCRERWKNHLDPSINKGPYTEEEDAIILEAQERMGNKWSQISQLLKGRTEDSVKIRWKSLKQNPAKAAASHAQNKRQQQAATAAFQSNAALMRQRQMQLIEHQRQLQQNEVSQQLHHQQQLQQEQLQLRLQEKLLQDKQLQGHSGGVPPHSPVLAAHSMAPEVGNSLIVKHEVVEPIPHDVMYPHHTDYDHLGMYPTYHPSQPPFPQHQHQTYHPDPFQQQVPYNIDTPPFNNSAAFGYSPQVSFQNLHDANGASSNNSSPSNDADIHAQLPPLVGHTDALWDLNNLPKEEVDISSSRLWNDLKPDSSNPFDHDDVDPDAMFETIAKELGNDSLQFTQL